MKDYLISWFLLYNCMNPWELQCFWIVKTLSFSMLQMAQAGQYALSISIQRLHWRIDRECRKLSLNTDGYTDDITLIASTITVRVIMCYQYSCKWRFVPGLSALRIRFGWVVTSYSLLMTASSLVGFSVITCHNRTILMFALVIAGVQCIVSVSITSPH